MVRGRDACAAKRGPGRRRASARPIGRRLHHRPAADHNAHHTKILETALYVDDLPRATAFYRDVLGLTVMSEGPRLAALDAGHTTVLLLFKRGATAEGLRFPWGWIPPHDGSGPAHFAFAIETAEIDTWVARLVGHGVAIESRVAWSAGGVSLYFRDPDGHSLELASPGVWPTY